MEDKIWQVAIIGAGPAGLFAALTASRRKKEVVLIGKERHSTRLGQTDKIENFPGVFEVISGQEISENLWKQVEKEQVSFLNEEIQMIGAGEGIYELYTRTAVVKAKTIILTIGVKLQGQLPGEKEFVGRGVSYCGNCDAPFFKNKNVAVIGYTKEGEEEANYLADFCPQVYYLAQYKDKTIRQLKSNVKLIEGKPKQIKGSNAVEVFETTHEEFSVQGVFIIRESIPPNELIPDLALEEEFIKVDRGQATNLPGVFAAGDCTGKPWQLAKAVGEAQVAALNAAKYIDDNEK